MRGCSHRYHELLAWYEVRDNLLGENSLEQDIKKAWQLSTVCQHPDAVWLTELFAGHDVSTRKEARQVFLGCGGDARALCFAALIGDRVDKVLLRQAGEKGCAYAQAMMADKTGGEEMFRWAQKSASQGERDGFYRLAVCYRYGRGCERSVERAKENYLGAAELGRMLSMYSYGKLLDKTDPQRFVWLGRAAPLVCWSEFLKETKEQMINFKGGTGRANVVFMVGKALKGQIYLDKRLIFGATYEYDSFIGPATQAFHFYNFQLQSYRRAVDCWTLVSIRNRVVKDVRKMIGNLIWGAREEARYGLKCNDGCLCPFCETT
jgi:hypothetical protein